jgi:hypothetical protein
MDRAFLDWALESFSGDVAADELYEGRYCVWSMVDNREDTRILYEVLDHDPTHDDITGSPLYPEPIRTVFGDVAHPICTFHVLKELTQGILRAVAAERSR